MIKLDLNQLGTGIIILEIIGDLCCDVAALGEVTGRIGPILCEQL
jgi:hypothetical protein